MWLHAVQCKSKNYQHFPPEALLPAQPGAVILSHPYKASPHNCPGVFDHTVIPKLATMPLAIGQLPWEVWLPFVGKRVTGGRHMVPIIACNDAKSSSKSFKRHYSPCRQWSAHECGKEERVYTVIV